jgi:hypothetical protein
MASRSYQSTLTAADVTRGVCRMFANREYACMAEFPLANGRRADVAALGPKAEMALVEIKISVADYLNDKKWPDYFEYADQLFFAVPHGFPLELFDRDAALPDRIGLMVTDGHEVAILREAPVFPLAPARRKAVTLSFARRAADRLLYQLDPQAWNGVR